MRPTTAIGFLVLALACSVEPRKGDSSEIVLCRLSVAEHLMRGSATFAVAYRGTVNGEGDVVDLQVVRSVSGVASITGCISDWKLGERWRNQDVSILLQWQHGKGWTTISIRGEEASLKIIDPAPPSDSLSWEGK